MAGEELDRILNGLSKDEYVKEMKLFLRLDYYGIDPGDPREEGAWEKIGKLNALYGIPQSWPHDKFENILEAMTGMDSLIADGELCGLNDHVEDVEDYDAFFPYLNEASLEDLKKLVEYEDNMPKNAFARAIVERLGDAASPVHIEIGHICNDGYDHDEDEFECVYNLYRYGEMAEVAFQVDRAREILTAVDKVVKHGFAFEELSPVAPAVLIKLSELIDRGFCEHTAELDQHEPHIDPFADFQMGRFRVHLVHEGERLSHGLPWVEFYDMSGNPSLPEDGFLKGYYLSTLLGMDGLSTDIAKMSSFSLNYLDDNPDWSISGDDLKELSRRLHAAHDAYEIEDMKDIRADKDIAYAYSESAYKSVKTALANGSITTEVTDDSLLVTIEGRHFWVQEQGSFFVEKDEDDVSLDDRIGAILDTFDVAEENKNTQPEEWDWMRTFIQSIAEATNDGQELSDVEKGARAASIGTNEMSIKIKSEGNSIESHMTTR